MGQEVRRRGFSLVEVIIAASVLAVALIPALYALLNPAANGDPDLHVRVEFQLEAVRVLRAVTAVLKNSAPAGQGADGMLWTDGSKEKGGGAFSIAVVGNELQLRRFDDAGAVCSMRLLGRDVERITFETAATEPKPVAAPRQALGANQVRITAWFRRVLDGKVYAVRQSGTVKLRRPER
jgi:prepilin-type N-terminal cleavage/methylation domain-containing protein